MKTKILTNWVRFICITFLLCCRKNDFPVIDKKDTYTDSTSLDSSHVVRQDSLCIYKNIILDTNSFGQIDQNSIIGKWKLVSYADVTNCTIINEPKDIANSVEINFSDSINVSGNTIANGFSGKYKLKHDSISIFNLQITLMLEPEWGSKFIHAISNTDLATMRNDTLIIYYSETKNAMILHKN